VRLGVVIVDGTLAGSVIDRGGADAGGLAERRLHRGGAGGAAHPFDGQNDTSLTHGARAAKARAADRRWRALRRGGPSAWPCTSTRTSCTPATVGANACDPLENRKYHSTQTMAARPTAVTTYCETLTPSRNTRCRGG